MLKLSEIAVATSNVLADLIPKYLDNVSCYFVLPTTVLEYMLMSVALDYPHELRRACFSIEQPGIITQQCQGRNARVSPITDSNAVLFWDTLSPVCTYFKN